VSNSRALDRVVTLPAPSRGQFGPDHRVVEVITPDQWSHADPFILLMDDRIDGKLIGGPHPHAGFETVTFVVDGEMSSESGAGERLGPGDVEWTTAGSGIVHGSAGIEGKLRVLQLWLTLPAKDRWTEPDHQRVPAADVPVRREPGAVVHLYSGTTGSLTSTTRNRVPVTLVHVELEAGASVEQAIPLSYSGFLYVLEGQARVGAREHAVTIGQVGWLDRAAGAGDGSLRISNAGEGKLRLVLYAGAPQATPIVSYGPFIGDTPEDILRSFERYRAGTFRRY
jgi:redox-sensitive bicupin YhaK (pirin superfamily)